MNKILIGALALAAAGTATSANAAITLGSVTPGSTVYAGPTPTYNFNPGSRPVTTGGTYYTDGDREDARPLGSTGSFFSAGIGDSPATLAIGALGPISSLSFIWGSVDTYNTLSFLNAAGQTIYSITGTQLLGQANANGNQTASQTNPVVSFNFTGADQNVAFMSLNSGTVNAFEIDNLAISAVPEPAAWALMVLGMGVVGGSLRRRRSVSARYANA